MNSVSDAVGFKLSNNNNSRRIWMLFLQGRDIEWIEPCKPLGVDTAFRSLKVEISSGAESPHPSAWFCLWRQDRTRSIDARTRLNGADPKWTNLASNNQSCPWWRPRRGWWSGVKKKKRTTKTEQKWLRFRNRTVRTTIQTHQERTQDVERDEVWDSEFVSATGRVTGIIGVGITSSKPCSSINSNKIIKTNAHLTNCRPATYWGGEGRAGRGEEEWRRRKKKELRKSNWWMEAPWEEHEYMISCQASPVADRNRTKTACGNVWKLLLRWMAVSSSSAIFPKTWNRRQISSIERGQVHDGYSKIWGWNTRPAFRRQRRWRRPWESIERRKAGPEKIWWTSTIECGCPLLYSAIWPAAWRETTGRNWWRWCWYQAVQQSSCKKKYNHNNK